MFTLATTLILLSATGGPPASSRSKSDDLPDAPSAQFQQQSNPPSSPPPPLPPTPTHPSSQWLRVESLQPGNSIAIQEPGRRFPTPCRFDDVTDDTITCIVFAPGSAPRRTVYPIANIAAVYIDEWTDGPTRTPLILGGALGGFLGGGLCSQASAGTIATCVLVGAAIGVSIAIAPSPYPVPARPHLRRRLIYHAP